MKKFLLLLGTIILIGLAILLLTASGGYATGVQVSCSDSFPEEAAIRHVREMASPDMAIDMNTVNALQAVKMNDLTLVLVQYSGSRMNGNLELCEIVVETERTLVDQWVSRSSAGLCHEMYDADNSVPMTIISNYGNSTLLHHGYSTACGYIRDTQITQVLITWEDGLVQQAGVESSTYMAAREGDYSLSRIDALNGQDEVVYTSNLGGVQSDGNR